MISVILPTHNPHPGRLAETLEGLRQQALPLTEWELVIVDNASTDRRALEATDLAWHPAARIVREEQLGLTAARLRGFGETQGELVVLVDDDNVLAPDYLSQAAAIFQADLLLGAAGGRSIPRFGIEPEKWVREFDQALALRDLGGEPLVAQWIDGAPPEYPRCAPIGAGMVLRRETAKQFADAVARRREVVMDRTGANLSSGGDNDIVLTVLERGWKVGYFPQLQLTHLIPPHRCTRDYLARLTRASSESWVRVLDLHGIRTWQPLPRWLLPPLKCRLYWRTRAWSDSRAFVEWRDRCGILEGRAALR